MDSETDRWVRSDEARAKLRDLLDEIAAQGSHIYVLRYDKPAAVMVPVDWYEAMRAGRELPLEPGETRYSERAGGNSIHRHVARGPCPCGQVIPFCGVPGHPDGAHGGHPG